MMINRLVKGCLSDCKKLMYATVPKAFVGSGSLSLHPDLFKIPSDVPELRKVKPRILVFISFFFYCPETA